MTQRLLILSSLLILAVLILVTLNLRSGKLNMHKNGFERTIIVDALQKDAEISLNAQVTRICGISNNTVYLQTRTPGLIYYTTDFKKLDTLRLRLPEISRMEVFYNMLRFPYLYILGVNARKLVQGNLKTGQIAVINLLLPGPCSNPVFISDQSLIVRGIDTASLNALFYKINIPGGTAIPETGISERLHDAGFIHDGVLLNDEQGSRLCYVHYYSNRITVFDTDLYLMKRYHTIDTITVPGMHIGKNLTSVTSKDPPVMINGPSAVGNGILYVRSYLQGDNEQDFDTRLPIDRYSVESGSYLGSYYLPYQRNEQLRGIMVTDDYLYALFVDKLARIKLKI